MAAEVTADLLDCIDANLVAPASTNKHSSRTFGDHIWPGRFKDCVALARGGHAANDDGGTASRHSPADVRFQTVSKRASVKITPDAPRWLAADQDGCATRTRSQRCAVAGHVANARSGLSHNVS